MIRTLLLSLCLLGIAPLTAHAQSLDGLRIEDHNRPILVYVDGEAVCSPTNSCFVAGLRGTHRIEVYEADKGRGNRNGRRLYHKQMRFNGKGVQDIRLGDQGHTPDRAEQHSPHPQSAPGQPPHAHHQAMTPAEFDRFVALVKKQSFDSERTEVLNHGLRTSYFTTDQCIRLLQFYHFSSEQVAFLKQAYPRCVDKGNYLYVVDKLSFPADRKEVLQYIEKYSQ